MAHEIETCFQVGEPAWHGLGITLPLPPTTPEVLEHAGLTWGVGRVPTFLASGVRAPGYAVIRSDTGAALAACGPDYTPLQAVQLRDALAPLVEAGFATWESGGALRAGARQWLQVRLSGLQADVVPGDTIRAFALATNAHDGARCAEVGDVCTRVVCSNTLAVARAEGRLRGARHTAGVAVAFESIAEEMRARVAAFHAQVDALRTLADKRCSEERFEAFMGEVMGAVSDRVLTRGRDLFHAGRGTSIDGVKGTWWGAYNAMSEYLQHERRGDAGARLDGIMFGDAARLNQRAMSIALAA